MERQAGGGSPQQGPPDGQVQGVPETAAVRGGLSDIQYAERSAVRGQQVQRVNATNKKR